MRGVPAPSACAASMYGSFRSESAVPRAKRVTPGVMSRVRIRMRTWVSRPKTATRASARMIPGQRQERVDQPLEEQVEPAQRPGRGHAQDGSDAEADRHGDHRQRDRDPRTTNDS